MDANGRLVDDDGNPLMTSPGGTAITPSEHVIANMSASGRKKLLSKAADAGEAAPKPVKKIQFVTSDRSLNISVMLSKLPPKEGIIEDLRLCRPLHKLPAMEVDRLKAAKKMPYNVMAVTERDYFVRMDVDQLESYKKLLPID